MKIVVIGTRGIPDIPGGVETHCEELYPRLVKLGYDVTVIRRTPYITDENKVKEYKGVKIIDVYAPRRKSFEAIIHTFLAVLKARSLRPDILHVHAIGPALMVPLARVLGMKVVSTNHGPDYNRQKWGRLAKMCLKTGERWGARYSNRVIVISKVIAKILADNYGRHDTDLIFNGVNIPTPAERTDYIESLGLEPGKYILTVGRLVEEKGYSDLIEAYKRMRHKDYKLVIAGDADHETEYSRNLKQKAREAGVVLTGYIIGEQLRQVQSHAALYAMPSYHEGLPIALLEAMSYRTDVAVSDIPAMQLDCLDSEKDYYHVGDIDGLAALLDRKLDSLQTPRQYDLSPYNWDNITHQISDLYKEMK